MAVTKAGAATSFSSNVTQATWTQSITIPSGTDCLVVVEGNANGGGGLAPLSVKVNGVSMTKIDGGINGLFECSMWRLLSPTSGTFNLVVDINSDASQANQAFWFAGLEFLQGVDQTTPVGNHSTNGGVSGVTSVGTTVTGSSAGDLQIGGVHLYATAISSVGSGQTSDSKQQNIGTLTSGSIDNIAGGSSGGFLWTGSGTTNNDWQATAAVFKAGAAGDTLMGQACL